MDYFSSWVRASRPPTLYMCESPKAYSPSPLGGPAAISEYQYSQLHSPRDSLSRTVNTSYAMGLFVPLALLSGAAYVRTSFNSYC